MTPSRIAAIAAIVLGVLAIAFVGLRGGDSHEYTLRFDDAGGLIKGNLVRVNGINMGTVSSIGTTRTADGSYQAFVKIKVDEFGPLRQGTFAQIRATSLAGVANKYIALSLAPNNAKPLADGATIGLKDTRGIIGQDEFVNAFDEPTRKGLQQLVKGSAEVVKGNSENLQKVLDETPTTLKELREFAAGLDPDGDALQDVVVNVAAINNALADHTEAIARLTRNSGVAAAATAGNGTEISETLARSPKVLDDATAVMEELPSTLAQVKRLILLADKYKAGVPERLRQLTDTLTSGKPTVDSLARTLNRDGKNNDVADLLAASVAVGAASKKASVSVPKALAGATPLLSETRAYTPDITAAITGLGLISANYDAAGHYARLSPVLNIFQLSGSAPNQDLVPRPSFLNRLQGLQTTTNRCPGSAAQATSDGSAPYTDGGAVQCNTGDVPAAP
ncbi:MAG: MCE family protein [Solirubrobacteraceae bacterium]|nr:MCE family protein [Solirubrobacteraceae bacterium]